MARSSRVRAPLDREQRFAILSVARHLPFRKLACSKNHCGSRKVASNFPARCRLRSVVHVGSGFSGESASLNCEEANNLHPARATRRSSAVAAGRPEEPQDGGISSPSRSFGARGSDWPGLFQGFAGESSQSPAAQKMVGLRVLATKMNTKTAECRFIPRSPK